MLDYIARKVSVVDRAVSGTRRDFGKHRLFSRFRGKASRRMLSGLVLRSMQRELDALDATSPR